MIRFFRPDTTKLEKAMYWLFMGTALFGFYNVWEHGTSHAAPIFVIAMVVAYERQVVINDRLRKRLEKWWESEDLL